MTIIEIIAVMFLYRLNRSNALKRKRKPTFFGAMTLILWFGFELVAVVVCGYVGLQLETDLMVITTVSLMAAALGGLISYLMAHNCTPGDYQPPPPPWAQIGPDGKPIWPSGAPSGGAQSQQGGPFPWGVAPSPAAPAEESEPEPELPPGAVLCPHCGQRLLEGTEVCVNCGKPIE